MIIVDEVSKRYRQGETDVQALDGVTLTVPKGEFLSIMGISGSGKSTLLQLLGGLDVPTSGSIAIGGTDLSDMSDDALTIFRRRHIGFVFQFFNLLPNLSVEENVAMPLLLDGAPLRRVQDRIHHMLERVGLAARKRHRPTQLSGGEMQRVAIARAMVIEPMLLLADEPTGNLDSTTGEEILGLIRQAATSSGQTVVMVTHDAQAAAWGERVLTLKDGRVVGDVSTRGARASEAAGAQA